MIVFATVVFFAAAALIGGLFALNIREYKSGRYPLCEWRAAADAQAMTLKELAAAADLDLKKVPPLAAHYAHVALHLGALGFARMARRASHKAHAVADFVSHKRNFERRATRSEFLKKMTEYKNGNDDGNGHEAQKRVEF